PPTMPAADGGAARAPAPRVAVILPARDEETTIAPCIADFHAALPGARIVVVDNGSRDRTVERARAAIAAIGGAGRLLTETRPGKGAAGRRAFRAIDADVYLLVDADSTYPADRARDLVAPILAGAAEMVVGDRRADGAYARGASTWRATRPSAGSWRGSSVARSGTCSAATGR
ncbi:MAG: glycosyltransferase, partial [Chloroflexota bacterium]